MRVLKPLPSQADLLEALEYVPSTGELWWRRLPKGFRYDDKARADRNNPGVGRYVVLKGERFSAARVAWVMVHGQLSAKACVRFKDGNDQNLRLDNLTLRRVSDRLRQVHPVYQHKADGWLVSAVVHGRPWPIGTYSTKDGAMIAFSKQEEVD